MTASAGDRWVPVFWSVLLHGLLLAALGWGWFQWQQRRTAPPVLAIEATVVEDSQLRGALLQQRTPEPQPAELARGAAQRAVEEQAQRATEQQAAEQRVAERRAAEQRAAAQRTVEARRAAEEQAVRERAEQAAVARAKAQQEAERAKAQQEAERRRLELAREQAENERRQSELRAQLAVEERQIAARASGQQAQYAALIRVRVESAWKRPPGARPGLDCELRITQVPGGTVTGVQFGACNGDAAVRESIEAAVYRASPLPVPDDPALFDSNIRFNFRPSD